MIDISGWRKRQIALDQKAENEKELGLDYEPAREPRWKEWRGLTSEEIEEGHKDSWATKQSFESAVWWAEKKLKERNT